MRARTVDVLAVLDSLLSFASTGVEVDDPARQLIEAACEARAAVAELIEAGTAYDAAMRSEADTDGMLHRESCRAQLRAALARCGVQS